MSTPTPTHCLSLLKQVAHDDYVESSPPTSGSAPATAAHFWQRAGECSPIDSSLVVTDPFIPLAIYGDAKASERRVTQGQMCQLAMGKRKRVDNLKKQEKIEFREGWGETGKDRKWICCAKCTGELDIARGYQLWSSVLGGSARMSYGRPSAVLGVHVQAERSHTRACIGSVCSDTHTNTHTRQR